MKKPEETINRLGLKTTNEWLTPPEIVKQFGDFCLDPCHSKFQKWKLAKNIYTIDDNGLSKNLKGRVWMNPPYDRSIKFWVKKFYEHGNGVALLPSRTGTSWFHDYVFKKGEVDFIRGRIKFISHEGHIKCAGMFDSVYWIINPE